MTNIRNIRLYIDRELATSQLCELSERESHYLCNVMRCKDGEFIYCFNDKNGEFLSKIVKINKKTTIIEPQKQINRGEAAIILYRLYNMI